MKKSGKSGGLEQQRLPNCVTLDHPGLELGNSDVSARVFFVFFFISRATVLVDF